MKADPIALAEFKLDRKAIGERIKARRIELSKTQEEIGKACGLSQNSVMKIEKGRTENSRFVPKIWMHLGLDLTELSDLYAKPPTNPLRPPGYMVVNELVQVGLMVHLLTEVHYQVVQITGEEPASGPGILITWTTRNGARISGVMHRAMIEKGIPAFARCARVLGIDLKQLLQEAAQSE